MKLFKQYLLTSLWLGATVAAPCLTGSFQLDVKVVENATTFTDCKSQLFVAIQDKMVEQGCDMSRNNAIKKELLELINLGNETLGRYIASVCEHARTRQDVKETFQSIARRATRTLDIQEYYDGGTYLNEEIGTLTVDGAFIHQIFDDIAQEEPIAFPSELVNFQKCRANAVLCCWVQDRHDENAANNGDCRQPYETACIDKDPADNTDICYVDMKRSRKSNHVNGGQAVFHSNFDSGNSQTEGKTHCHGFAWKQNTDSPSYRYRGNNLFYVSLYDHLHQRGYVRSVPGAPMCSCTDQAAVVSRSDCTEMAVDEIYTFSYDGASKGFEAKITSLDIVYNSCQGVKKDNDLTSLYERLVQNGDLPTSKEAIFKKTVVGKNQCPSNILSFMEGNGWKRITSEGGE